MRITRTPPLRVIPVHSSPTRTSAARPTSATLRTADLFRISFVPSRDTGGAEKLRVAMFLCLAAVFFAAAVTASPAQTLTTLVQFDYTNGSNPTAPLIQASDRSLYGTTQYVANAAIVPAGTSGDVAVYPSNPTNLVIGVDGYFAPQASGGLSLYPLTPCRVLDTRKVGNGQPFTGELSVNVENSPCALTASAQAYVFNATAVPAGGLGYLTLWPDGESQPVVSTLNAIDGAITSNMAIVPTSNGKIDAFASGLTQLILDISSYFAP